MLCSLLFKSKKEVQVKIKMPARRIIAEKGDFLRKDFIIDYP
jgi:hypothetical protein